MCSPRRRRRYPVQKIIFLLFLQPIGGTLRVIALHLQTLLRRELRQVPDEVDKLPTVLFGAGTRKRRHSRESHSIFDNPKKFAIGELLRFREPQVRRLGIKSAPPSSCRNCHRCRGKWRNGLQSAAGRRASSPRWRLRDRPALALRSEAPCAWLSAPSPPQARWVSLLRSRRYAGTNTTRSQSQAPQRPTKSKWEFCVS